MTRTSALCCGILLTGSWARAVTLQEAVAEAKSLVGRFRTSAPRTIAFSGRRWTVKASAEPAGPGPNLFSDDEKNVWVDDRGRLHLRITRDGGGWRCAEVVSRESLGYGTYTFTLEGRGADLDPNVVLGLFTYDAAKDADPAAFNREIDIELSRWGAAGGHDAQFVVQPADDPGAKRRFDGPRGAEPSTQRFVWRRGAVDFESWSGGRSLARWTSTRRVPEPGGENVRINLWLYGGAPPSDMNETEVVVTGFKFSPGR